MTEEEKNQAIEKANAYRQMAGMWAWKDLMEKLRLEKESKIAALLSSGSVLDLETTRGWINALNFLESELQNTLEVIE